MKEPLSRLHPLFYAHHELLRIMLHRIKQLFIHCPYFLPIDAGEDFYRALTLEAHSAKTYQRIQDYLLSTEDSAALTQTYSTECAEYSLTLSTVYQKLFAHVQAAVKNAAAELKQPVDANVLLHQPHQAFTALTTMLASSDVNVARFTAALHALHHRLEAMEKPLWRPLFNRLTTQEAPMPSQAGQNETAALIESLHKALQLTQQTGLKINLPSPAVLLLFFTTQINAEKISTMLSRSISLQQTYIQAFTADMQQELQKKLNTHYKPAYCLQKNTLLLAQWVAQLRLPRQFPSFAQPWPRALAVHRFLTEFKTPYLQQQVALLQQEVVVLIVLRDTWLAVHPEGVGAAPAVIYALTQQQHNLRTEIRRLEHRLQAGPLMPQVAANGAGLLVGTPHFKWAELWIQTSEAWSHQGALQQVPLMNVHLSPAYLKVFSLIGGSVMLGLDVMTLRYAGLTSVMLQTLVQFTLNDVRPLMAFSQRLGQDETCVLQQLPAIRQLMSLLLHVSVYCLMLGVSRENIVFFAVGFFFVQRVQWLMNYALHNMGTSFLPAKHTHAYQWVLSVNQHLSYMGGTLLWMYGVSSLLDFFKAPSDTDLLQDRALCQTYAVRCKQSALHTLGLPADTSLAEARLQWRALLKNHPDKLGANPNQDIEYHPLASAYRRLRELLPPGEKKSLTFH